MISFLIDENIPLVTVEFLRDKGFQVLSVSELAKGMEDEIILQHAFEKNLIVVTLDKDFGELVFHQNIPSKGVILIRIIPTSPGAITDAIYQLIKDNHFDPYGKFIVVREGHIREVILPTESE